MTEMLPLTDDLKKYLAPAFERKAKSITAIHVKQLTSYTDCLVIVEASSQRQVTAIAEHIVKQLREQKIKPIGTEGIKEGEWALLDYGHVIFHVFESRVKFLYDLEGLWIDAPAIDLVGMGKTADKKETDDAS